MELWQQLSDAARQAVTSARSLAREQGCNTVAPEHVALGILQQQGCLAWQVLEEMGIDPRDLHADLTDAAARHSNGGVAPEKLDFTTTTQRCMQMAWVEARKDAARLRANSEQDTVVSTAHLLLGLVSPASMANLRELRTHGVFYGEVGEILRRITPRLPV